MKYKVGDRVRIKSLDWYNENKDEYGNVKVLIKEMSEFCGEIMTIKRISGICYIMEESDIPFAWTDEMIEGLMEKEMSLDKARQITDFEYEELAYTLPDGYQFVDENGNVINATKIVLEKKEKEYPKTYKECCAIIGAQEDRHYFYTKKDKEKDYPHEVKILKLLDDLRWILICRDAYWQIAGEEMGLDGPWEPDWKNSEERRYCIVNIEGDINLPEKILTKWILKVTNKILVFPTEEMRDVFYENFKELIEQCKELL